MLNPRISEGAPASLFERLVDHHPEETTEVQPFRMLNKAQLKASVREELGRLLNTRCPVPAHLLSERERSVIDYGIPDFSTFSAKSARDRTYLAWLLGRTISAYEPRLRQVQVSIEESQETPRALLVTIEAQLVIGTVTEPVSFPTLIQQKTGEAEVLDG